MPEIILIERYFDDFDRVDIAPSGNYWVEDSKLKGRYSADSEERAYRVATFEGSPIDVPPNSVVVDHDHGQATVLVPESAYTEGEQ